MTDNLKNLLKHDTFPYATTPMYKQLQLIFGDITITNNDIVGDSFQILEKICSGSNLQYGACEGSELHLTVANITDDLVGQECEVKMFINEEDVPLGFFTVDSAKRQTDLIFKDIVAYDRMKKFDVDVAEWYNALDFTNMTLASFRLALCTKCGVEEDTFTSLPNDSMTVSKTITATELSGREVLTACEQLNGCFGHIGRNGKLQHIVLPTTSCETVTTGMCRTAPEFEEYTVKAIDKIQIKSGSDDIGAIYGTGTNAYIIQDNFLVYGKTASELETIAENLSANVFLRPYKPCKAEIIGLPYIGPGDLITIDSNATYVMQRTLTGIQSLSDSYVSKGSEYATNVVSSNRDIKAIKSKLHKIVNTIEQMISSIESIDNWESRISSIEQTADKIESVVKYTGTIVSDELEVGDSTIIYPSVGEETMSSIKQTATAIQALISAETTRAGNAESNLQTQITANAQGIDAKISSEQAQTIAENTFSATAQGWSSTIRQEVIDNISGDIATECQSVFSQSASQIQSTVEANVRDSISDSLSTMQSQITQTANSVSSRITSAEAQSLINQTVDNITLTADKINLNGFVSANNSFHIDTSGTLYVQSGYINTLNGSGGQIDVGSAILFPAREYLLVGNQYVALEGHSHNTYGSIQAEFSNSSIGSGDLIRFSNTSGAYQAATANYVNTKISSSSDRRLKQNVSNVLSDDIKDMYMQLNPVSFKYKPHVGNQYVHYGFIAQDVADIFPEDEYDLVNVNNVEITEFQRAYCPTGIYEINYNNLHALHTKMIQKHETEIQELKAENEALKERLDRLEAMLNVN